MNEAFAPPTPTTFDAATTAAIALVYLVVGIAALARAPRDGRTRAFLALAILNLGPAIGSVVLWRQGADASWSKGLIALLLLTTLDGSVALFHFTQLFPRRRPWIARRGRWLVVAYALITAVALALIWLAPPSVDELTVASGLAILILAVPLIGVGAVLLPLAGLLSLYKSYLEGRTAGPPAARRATWWMLVSQLAGGILAAIVLPLLHMIRVPAAWTTAAGALFFVFGLLMPLAFAAAVWPLDVLSSVPETHER